MPYPFRRALLAAALALALLPGAVRAESPPPPSQEVPAQKTAILPLQQALARAEAHNRQLALARYQMTGARNNIATAPQNAAQLAPAASLYAQAQFGVTLPEGAISPAVATRQAQLSFEQSAAQYAHARQQVRLGTLQAYVEWQRAAALVTAYRGALDRALAQEANVAAALAAGAAARLDLLQAQAQVAGQQAALDGALARQEGARQSLAQLLAGRLGPDEAPEPLVLEAAAVRLETGAERLTARARRSRPDLRQSALDLTARRQQSSLAGGAALQVETAATQYHVALLQAETEVGQALLQAESALQALKAREAALAPAQEALRLAELRYDAGLAAYLEVRSAFAAALQAEASRIEAAADLTIALAQFAQATGDL